MAHRGAEQARTVEPTGSLTTLSTSEIREYLPGIFAARLHTTVAGGQARRVVHLLETPEPGGIPESLRAYCSTAIYPARPNWSPRSPGCPA
ncbi:hypothetical protein J2S53_001413 [Actinopolyspora lacussalsi]|nr:hypothetical protein [Actinopolyspora lacussalsi]